MSDIAPRYRAARKYAGLTQAELAEKLGIDEQTVKRRERGGGDPKRAEMLALASITGVPFEFLEGGWEALAAPLTDDQVRRAAAILRPALAQAGLALRQAPEAEPKGKDEPGPSDAAAEGDGA